VQFRVRVTLAAHWQQGPTYTHIRTHTHTHTHTQTHTHRHTHTHIHTHHTGYFQVQFRVRVTMAAHWQQGPTHTHKRTHTHTTQDAVRCSSGSALRWLHIGSRGQHTHIYVHTHTHAHTHAHAHTHTPHRMLSGAVQGPRYAGCTLAAGVNIHTYTCTHTHTRTHTRTYAHTTQDAVRCSSGSALRWLHIGSRGP